MSKLHWFIYIAIFVRLVTQMSCGFIADADVQGLVYAIGVAYFELSALIVFTWVLNKEDFILSFVIGLCGFDLFKFLFLNPFQFYVWEYLNVVFGFIFILVVWMRKKFKNK